MILSALCDYYDALLARGDGTVPPNGYSDEAISYVLVLDPNGTLVDIEDRLDLSGKRPVPKRMSVPAAFKRPGTMPKSFFLWDKTSYVLGVTAADDDSAAPFALAPEQHQAFKHLHLGVLAAESDPGAHALKAFLGNWDPARFAAPPFRAEMLDRNVAFRIDGESQYLHEHQALRDCWARLSGDKAAPQGMCLVTGVSGPVASVHPAIKGVLGAQTSGASIVSFNQSAFTSYGKEQGENAPISQAAAFKYPTALNFLLRNTPRNRQRLIVADTTVVFWAQAAQPVAADAAVSLLAAFLDPAPDNEQETQRLRTALQAIGQGRPLKALDARLAEGTQIFVLGLAPSTSRLSIRFWITDQLDVFAKRLAEHFQDLALEPTPWRTPPGVRRLVQVTAPCLKGSYQTDHAPPALAGELLRAVLTGTRYPATLLANLVMRMRADHEIDGVRIALCKAVLARAARQGLGHDIKEIPVGLDAANTDVAYLLGRLFATLEEIQQAALGRDLNTTIRDRFFGSASANPASVFPALLRYAQNHLARLRRNRPGAAVNLDKQLISIIGALPASLPKQQTLQAQGRFAIGFYHQAQQRYARRADSTDEAGPETEFQGEEAQ